MNNGYFMGFNKWAFDKRIKSDLGLLLIISSLCAEKGYCYASNPYLANLFDIDESSISRKLKNLETAGYITIEYTRRGAEITARHIRLTEMPFDDLQKCQPTIDKNVKENNTSINNTNINSIYNNIIDAYENEIGRLTPYQYEKLITYTVDLKPDMIIEAIHRASRMNKRNLAYVEGILKNWIQNGYKTLGDIKEKKKEERIDTTSTTGYNFGDLFEN